MEVDEALTVLGRTTSRRASCSSPASRRPRSSFRRDQLDTAADLGGELVLRFEETQDGTAKLARLTSNGMDVELFHILAFT